MNDDEVKIRMKLSKAIYKRDMKKIEKIVKQHRAVFNHPDYCPLHSIAYTQPSYHESSSRVTEDCMTRADIFIKKVGVDINKKDENGAEALYYATLWLDRFDMCKLFLDNGADPDGGTRKGEASQYNPLITALDNSHFGMAKLLIKRGADVTAISPASTKGYGHLRSYIKNTKWKNGALYFAITAEWGAEYIFKMCKMILIRGADPNQVCYIPNRDGTVIKTRVLYLVYKRCADHGFNEVDVSLLALFREFGADPRLSGERFGLEINIY